MKILFLTLYPQLQPSVRFRVIQFLPYLENRITWTIKPAVPGMVFNRFYCASGLFVKFIFHVFEFLKRLIDIILSLRYDAVFLQKGIATINYYNLDKLLFIFNKNVIFEFDDAVIIQNISSFSKFPMSKIVDKNQVHKIIKSAKLIITGNRKLKADIEGLNDNIIIIPTPVDTNYYKINLERYKKNEDCITILWSGNRGAHIYLKLCSQVIRELAKKFNLQVMILSDGEAKLVNEIFKGLKINFIEWSIDKENEAFSKADIGIMPIYDTLWDRRKCAFKALLYMANGIPVVSSPVGIINNFIKDGENGFLADSDKEWLDKLEILIKDSDLRMKMGLSGRKTIEQEFSLFKWGPVWGETIKNMLTNKINAKNS